MGQAAKVPKNSAEPYVPRIRKLLERADLRGARTLLAEALNNSSEPELEKLSRLLATPKSRSSPATEFDRSTELRWLAEHGRSYAGEWVAVLGDQLLAHAPTLAELRVQLDEVERHAPAILHFIQPRDPA